MASSMAALSRTERDRTWWTDRPPQPSPTRGPEGVRARVGYRPKSPQQEAGMRIEPPPSLPCASGAIPVATAAAAPPEDPPAVSERFQGLRVAPVRLVSVDGASPSSGVVVLPNM